MKDKELVDIIDHLIPVSAFSKGQTAKVIEDVAEKNQKYIILKNNQPKAVLLSLKHFREIAEKAEKFEALNEKIEEHKLLKVAEAELENYDAGKAATFDEVLKELEISKEELEKEIDTVEIE